MKKKHFLFIPIITMGIFAILAAPTLLTSSLFKKTNKCQQRSQWEMVNIKY